jgi:hypothetical protein
LSGEIRVTPPSVGDVLLAGKAYGWPALQGEGVDIPPGEDAWRVAITPDTAALVWETLHEMDLEGDAADAPGAR